jgi:hypothetical protein
MGGRREVGGEEGGRENSRVGAFPDGPLSST